MLFLVLTSDGVFVSLWRSLEYAQRAADKKGPGHVVIACGGGSSQSVVYRTGLLERVASGELVPKDWPSAAGIQARTEALMLKGLTWKVASAAAIQAHTEALERACNGHAVPSGWDSV